MRGRNVGLVSANVTVHNVSSTPLRHFRGIADTVQWLQLNTSDIRLWTLCRGCQGWKWQYGSHTHAQHRYTHTSLVPSPLPSAILTKARKGVWHTEPTFLGLVMSHSQNREYQSDCRSVTFWKNGVLQTKDRAAFQTLHVAWVIRRNNVRASSTLWAAKTCSFPYFPCVIPSRMIWHDVIRPRNVGSVSHTTFCASVKMADGSGLGTRLHSHTLTQALRGINNYITYIKLSKQSKIANHR